jgi:hypothetical protein
MPAPEMFPPSALLKTLEVTVEDRTPDLIDCVTVTIKVGYSDGDRFTIGHADVNGTGLGELPGALSHLLSAFLWGEGATGVLGAARALDGSAQSRRVRRIL